VLSETDGTEDTIVETQKLTVVDAVLQDLFATLVTTTGPLLISQNV